MLSRTGIMNKDFFNEIEIIEETFNYYKIETKGLMAPLKVFIR